MVMLDLAYNLSLLVALSVVSGFAGQRFRRGRLAELVQGLIFGGVAVVGMLKPLVMGPGLIFDGRSVVISLCGLFFGPVSAGVASLMAATLRAALGGVGVYMGVLVIASSGVLGAIFHRRRLKRGGGVPVSEMFLFGVLVHIFMLCLMFALPFDMAVKTIGRLGPAIMLTYPLATVIIGKILSDQMDRRNFFEALKAGGEELSTTLYSIGDGVITTDSLGRVRRMNPAAESLTGWTETSALGRPLDDVFPIINEETRAAVENPVSLVLREGRVVGLANHTLLIARDGVERPIADSGAPIRGEDGSITGVVLVFRDQSAERAVLRSMAESEERFRTLVENAPDAIFIQTEYRFAYLNRACVQLLGGDTPGEFLGRPVIEHFHAEYREQVLARIKTLNEAGVAVGRAEETMVRLDGSLVEAEISAVPFAFSGKNGALVFVRDISARKKAERQIEKLSRTHIVLSGINKAIVRIREPEALVREACRIAVDDGGFLMAWIGFLEPETGRVGVAAYAGMNGDYLENLNIVVSDEPRGRGPTAAALVSGKPVMANDIENDPKMAPWRENALRLGYRSSAAFPFKVKGQLHGVMNFYSDQPDFFDEREAAVLEELAADVSFALEAADSEEERRSALSRLSESEERFRSALDNIPDVVVIYDTTLTIRYINRATEKITGRPASFFIGKREEEIWPPEVYKAYMPSLAESLETGEIRSVDAEIEIPGADPRYLFITCVPLLGQDGRVREILGITHDLTEYNRAERERNNLNAQLLQAQKMEAVGRLAGGVAHDFNNMLGVILGNAELAMGKLDESSVVREDINEIIKAGRRSADLTRQLLAFARKQTIAPKVLDLNDTIASMLKMLRRLIGEDIDLSFRPGPEPCLVNMDPAQIDQILANLTVNARDAIVGVGKISIESSRVFFDDDYCENHPGFLAGSYVLVAVSDNGCGMDRQTQERLFEPFFTTKEMGKGTGLGLATLYGIVRQNNGFVNVYSEPGIGTTFRIYLPLDDSDGVVECLAPRKTEAPKGAETVLLVEDERALLKITKRLLEQLGYKVLAAGGPNQALAVAGEYEGEIHLLVTDVIMPEMSGRDLMRIFQEKRPGMKCLFLSGYTSNVIAHHGVLDEGVHFLQKPFSREEFAVKLREALSD